jgi:hypothetical protein
MMWLFLPGRRDQTLPVATRLVSSQNSITIHSNMIEREEFRFGLVWFFR